METRQKIEILNNCDIKYYSFSKKSAKDGSNLEITKEFNFSRPKNCNNEELVEINLKASNYQHITYNIEDNNDHWFKNLSNILILKEVQALLQLGENFCLPFVNSMNTTIEFAKHIEYNFMRLKIPKIDEVRNRLIPLIKDIPNTSGRIIKIENVRY